MESGSGKLKAWVEERGRGDGIGCSGVRYKMRGVAAPYVDLDVGAGCSVPDVSLKREVSVLECRLSQILVLETQQIV